MARRWLRLTAWALAGCIAPALAHASGDVSPAGGQITFSVAPKLCILSAGEAACEDRLQAAWRAPAPLSVCLFLDGDADALKCWSEAYAGRHTFTISAASDLRLVLRREDGGVVAARTFEVVHDDRRRRRRVRNPWSFF